MRSRQAILTLGFIMGTLLMSSCVPGVQTVVQAPQFSLRGELQLVSFEPPLLGAGQVVFRVPLEVYNPNDFEASLSRIDFDFFVNNRLALSSAFSEGISLKAKASSPLGLAVTIPLSSGIALISDISNLIAGQQTLFHLDGRVTIDVFGVAKIFAKTTLVSGQVN